MFFLDLSSKAKESKAKINKWDPIKLKRFFKAKETIHKTRRQSTEWQKIFTYDRTDKGFIFKIYKQLIELNIKVTNSLIKKIEGLNRLFQRRHADGQQAHEKMFNITNHQGNAN